MTCVRFLPACVLVVAACGGDLVESITTPLTIDVRLATDTLVPGDAVATTTVIRNRLDQTVRFSGNSCVLGIEIVRADGSLVQQSQGCSDVLRSVEVGPRDSLTFNGTWDATYVANAPGRVPLPPGPYGLRAVIRANEFDLEGEPAAVTVLPWGRARLVHTGLGLPPLDLVVGGRVASSSVVEGTIDGGGVVPAGRQFIELRAHGEGGVLGTMEGTIAVGANHAVAVRTATGGEVEPWLLPDTGGVAGPHESRLRVIHLASAVGPIDVWRTQPDYGAFVRIMFPFPYGASSPYLLSDAGAWRVLVTPADGSDTLLLTGPMPLSGGDVRTLILMDDGAGGITASLIDP